jgi:hypothetical protein
VSLGRHRHYSRSRSGTLKSDGHLELFVVPTPSATTTLVPWSIQTVAVGSLAVPAARLSLQLYCRSVLPARRVTTADCWIDTGAPLTVVPFHVHNQRLQWQPILGTTVTWAGKRCDLGHVDIWLPTEEPPHLRGPFSLFAKFARQDPPGDPVPILLGLEFFLTNLAEFVLLPPPQQSVILVP